LRAILNGVLAASLLVFSRAAAETPGAAAQIVLPQGGDEFARLAARAAAHDESVDFRALRLLYLKSAQRKQAKDDVDALQKNLFEAVKAADRERVRDAAIKLLSADYVDMYGHKFLRQACKLMNDGTCAEQSHFVEFGLLRSITEHGDGKTCETGWEVVLVSEEYFMLAMLDARPVRQSLQMGPPSCDRQDVLDENGKNATYYFRIETVLADEAERLGIGHQ
jgi:hypothetical protein